MDEEPQERTSGAREGRPPLPDLLAEREKPLHPGLRIAALVGGSLCMVLGVVGWLVPIVTGIPFYILGLALLGAASRRVRHAINTLEHKLPWRLRLLLRPRYRKRQRSEGGG